jgi:pimeloyl-ACP methyl ester carboxylesterase
MAMIDARQAVLSKNDASTGGTLSALRFGFRALSAVSPSLAARLAGRIWFTPPHAPLSDAAKAALASGSRFEVQVDGRKVAAWSWGDAKAPAVLLMHGWGGNAAQMASFVEPLVRAGYRAIAFDAPAHGSSEATRFGGRRTTLFEFSDALVEIARGAGEIKALIAHSGGCTAAGWAIRNGWRVPAAVFIAPMGSPIRYQQIFQQALGISDEAMRRFSTRTEEWLAFKWADLEMTGVPQIATTPRTLVIHDRDDRETSWREGASIAESWPNAAMRTVEGLGHRRVLRDAATIGAVVEFITAT